MKAAMCVCAAIGCVSSAGVVHDEEIDGDLSTDPLAPTSVALEVGANEVRGTVQSPVDTRDYITLTNQDRKGPPCA